MCRTDPTLYNVKIRFNTDKNLTIPTQFKKKTKYSGNIRSLTIKGFAYVLFGSGVVNVTRIKDLDAIDKAVDVFEYFFKVSPVDRTKVFIDNTTAAGILECAHISLRKIVQIKRSIDKDNSPECVANISPYFHSAIIKQVSQATLFLYPSGKYTILGANTVDKIRRTHKSLCAIVKRHLLPIELQFHQLELKKT